MRHDTGSGLHLPSAAQTWNIVKYSNAGICTTLALDMRPVTLSYPYDIVKSERFAPVGVSRRIIKVSDWQITPWKEGKTTVAHKDGTNGEGGGGFGFWWRSFHLSGKETNPLPFHLRARVRAFDHSLEINMEIDQSTRLFFCSYSTSSPLRC